MSVQVGGSREEHGDSEDWQWNKEYVEKEFWLQA